MNQNCGQRRSKEPSCVGRRPAVCRARSHGLLANNAEERSAVLKGGMKYSLRGKL